MLAQLSVLLALVLVDAAFLLTFLFFRLLLGVFPHPWPLSKSQSRLGEGSQMAKNHVRDGGRGGGGSSVSLASIQVLSESARRGVEGGGWDGGDSGGQTRSPNRN